MYHYCGNLSGMLWQNIYLQLMLLSRCLIIYIAWGSVQSILMTSEAETEIEEQF